MIWPSEFSNSSHPLEQRGTIELNLDHVVTRQSLPKVLFKAFLAGVMFLIGLGILVPFFPGPAPVGIGFGSIMIVFYCASAHYIRPRPNFDNMGWAAGLFNDPCQFNDNVNRFLWNLSCFLGPGRFMAASTLEALVTFRILPERSDADVAEYHESVARTEWANRAGRIMERVEEIDSQRPQGRTQLASMRFLEMDENHGAQDDPTETVR